jgi:hypothetical protein
LERVAELMRENQSLRAQIKILTKAVTAGNEGYLATLRKQEAKNFNSEIGDEK